MSEIDQDGSSSTKEIQSSSTSSKEEARPSKVVSVASSQQKRPPPEPRDHIRRRLYIILSFWAIVIFLGLPIWRWSTSIYRAKLPLREMMEWADGKVCARGSYYRWFWYWTILLFDMIYWANKDVVSLSSLGMSIGLSIADIRRSSESSGTRDTASHTIDSTCIGWSEWFLDASS